MNEVLKWKSKNFIELPPSTASSLYDGSEIGWEQKKTLGNLIYFHHFYYPHTTTALQSIHLPHHLSRSRCIFLSITYLLEISIKMSQRYFRLSHPNLFPSVLYKKFLAPPRNHSTFPSLPQASWSVSVCLSCSKPSPFLWLHSIQTHFVQHSYNNNPASSLTIFKIHFPFYHQTDYFSMQIVMFLPA